MVVRACAPRAVTYGHKSCERRFYPTAANEPFGAFNRNYAEVKLATTIDVPGPASGFLATGFGVAEGFGTPDWRALAGIRVDTSKKATKAEDEPLPLMPDDDKPHTLSVLTSQFLATCLVTHCSIAPLDDIEFHETVVASLLGLVVSFRMIRLPDPVSSGAAEGLALG